MRHKIPYRVGQAALNTPGMLEGVCESGVCESDETYVLESVKGRKIPESYHRKSRKRVAKVSKPGLSDKYICVCTSVDSANNCMTAAVNRAVPSKDKIE